MTNPLFPGVAEDDAPQPFSGQPAQAIVPPKPSYGWKVARREEFDLELPSGSYVRCRKLGKPDIFKLNLFEVLDSFTPELIKQMQQENLSDEEAAKMLMDNNKRQKLFDPIDRVVCAAVLSPPVVEAGETNDTQINVSDVEIEDKVMIFRAALGEQLDSLKSVGGRPKETVRNLPEG